MIDVSNLVFMDFEASAGRDGFPVEVGWSWMEANAVYFNSMLISPADEWLTPAFTWDPFAESIHGLTLDRLQSDGLAASEVCQTLNQRLRDRVVVFDTGADGIDRYWMDILFSEAMEVRTFKLGGPIGEFLKAWGQSLHLSEGELESIRALAPPITHRAADDAVHYAWRAAAMRLVSKHPEMLSSEKLKIETHGNRRH